MSEYTFNEYTFILRAEIAETAHGNTEGEAREALQRSEGKWTVTRPNGQVIMITPNLVPIRELQGDGEES